MASFQLSQAISKGLPAIAPVRKSFRARAEREPAPPRASDIDSARSDEVSETGHDSFLCKCASAPAIPIKMLSLQAGDTIGRDLRLMREIGAGGMGRVYEGRDLRLGRAVAVKLVRISACGARTAQATLQRFEREAKLTARLNHPNVVTLYDAGVWQDVPYLVFELLHGAPLSQRVHRRDLSPRAIAAVMAQAADGLAHAHGLRVVHGDLKPANIFLKPDGQVKLLDFGLAQPSLGGSELIADNAGYAGTAAYLAPEQWAGRTADVRTDMWAMGVTLFELLTGELPFDKEEGYSRSSRGVGLVSKSGCAIPEKFSVLISSLLARDPARRCKSASLLADRLWRLSDSLNGESDARRVSCAGA